MGVITSILRAGGAVRDVGETVGGVAEVFVGNQAERDAAAASALAAAVGQYGAEFARAPAGRFDGFVDGLNRLPRPLLALSTISLFVYAMAEPAGFSLRMQGLALVPEPLWWLLGAIVSFYFGARELHHQRLRSLRAALPRLVAGAAVATVPPVETAEEAAAGVPSPMPVASLFSAATCAAPVTAPAPAPVAPAPSRAKDPDWNAAVEEWQRLAG